MTWMIPAVITTLVGSILLSLTYWAFFFLYRKQYLLLWAASWSVYSLRYVFLLPLLVSGPNPALYFGNLATIVISLFLLYRGTLVFIGRKMTPAWNLVFAAIFFWTAIGVFADFSFLLLTIPLFGVMAWINIWVGWIILRSDLPTGAGKTVVGVTFILWGLHRANFPFLRPMEWFAPFGYLIATLCAVTIAFGMILLFFKKMYMDLTERDAHLRRLFDDAIYGIGLADPETGILVDCNRAFAHMLGYSREEIIGRPQREFHPEEENEGGLTRIFRRHLQKDQGQTLESRMVTASGDIIDVEIRAAVVQIGKKRLMQGFFRDISERKRTRQELAESEALSRLILDSAAEGIYGLDREGHCSFCNHSGLAMLGYAKEQELIGSNMHERIHHHKADGSPHPVENCSIYASFLEGRKIHLDGETLWRADGTSFPAELWSHPVLKNEKVIGAVISFIDITDRKRTEEKLRHHKDLLEKSQQLGQIGTWEYDIENDHLLWTDEIHRIFCIPFETELNYSIFMRRVHPDDRGEVDRRWQAALEGEAYELEHRLLIGRETRWVRQKASLEFTYSDQPVRAIGFVQDITERKQGERERERLENQLRQAQKIETVGRLAGGVAHDYNNMLGVIIGYAELAQMKVVQTDPLQEDLEQILAAAKRSRDVTRKLLAFARKQTLDLKVLDLNEAVESMLKMLRQLLGEHIDLIWEPANDLCPVEIDPSQLDQILANLCINARDAITDTGKMTIETELTTLDQTYCNHHPGFTPGDFVVLAVSDNGCGMNQETLENIYEPFFTTKPLGSGTGLGLATVYGIVKQSKGYINVYSEPGLGTTFKIYLPRFTGQAESETPSLPPETPRGRGETVLVVEDEQAILKLTKTMLTDLGYQVLTSDSPVRALTLAEAHAGEIQLLITDVVMPEMNGRELAERLQLAHPGLQCLYMSGYTGNAIAHHGILGKGTHFLHKPFSRHDLASQVSQILTTKP
ncbi:MAG TPA: PAS domain S-box protein [Desulfuromonadales bacterium]|nr:PAS domain S-box protein [Desulfuromonadales bacterium]